MATFSPENCTNVVNPVTDFGDHRGEHIGTASASASAAAHTSQEAGRPKADGDKPSGTISPPSATGHDHSDWHTPSPWQSSPAKAVDHSAAVAARVSGYALIVALAALVI
jgi:hypothetical protein